ncbi:MAG: ATP-NAD kinase [Sulfobacillus acidophilus]|uniref:ATP-NAD kinase n=1 Tax=Sulfobacillus acidophilus TaxID=53633 RepID=A0A2T2WLH1_9FIRM|nr:MAG: ATP-NAD kinase [Sulfobacillus acidophilus]
MAGRDIRRLVAHASLQSQAEKALIAHRIVAGIAAVPGVRVLVPEDRSGFFSWLSTELPPEVPVELVSRPAAVEDSTMLWVSMLEAAGARALIVVGGDGTQRNVAQAHPKIPVLPVAGGTNNVACYLGDQTAGGYAVAYFVKEGGAYHHWAVQSKLLHVELPGGVEEMALIDVALTRQNFTGAMAVWDPSDVQALVLSRADALRPGLSNVGAFVSPVGADDDFGLYLSLGDRGRACPAVMAPGLMATFHVEQERYLGFGDTVELHPQDAGGSLAFDGERTVVLSRGQSARITLRRDGPWVLDPARILTVSKRSVPS